MLLTPLIHPQLAGALAGAGHGATVLIADGNYPMSTGVAAGAEKVYLNLTPGCLSVNAILGPILQTVAVESAAVMVPEDGAAVAAHREYREMLPAGLPWNEFGRFEFYDTARSANLALAIASADQRPFANLLLTIGVRPPQS
ncbi:MAG: RbsD/FucU family protein [Propionibacteriaceae bacterium]|jgi:L-fucose mutarotase|nr:RbsD/FucU family protein [Propionibacteriaceae bacterium]